ncbi:reductive dehalogenase [Dehalococcoides sp.]|uniref:reductive dehalogenase n=1 Tax=Dehalococcoides sp. TaxID=1966486 RepID=UPI002ACB05A5|nr:reductive dehalogenase [Dehalococcoides sp.]
MSNYHSIVSRKDFMKGLGLAGASLGVASVATPVFRDLDELTASSSVHPKRAWYVKEREFGDIGIEIDWNILKRRDLTGFAFWNPVKWKQAYPAYDEAAFQKALDSKTKEIWPDYMGPTTRDHALNNASHSVGVGSYYYLNVEQGKVNLSVPAPRPEAIGMPKWQGTPEENSQMIRAVFSLVGLGPAIGVIELDEKSKNFVWEYNYAGKRIIFDDNITERYDTVDPPTIHIPSSHKYVIVTHNMSSDEILRRAPATIGIRTEELSYSRVGFAKSWVEQFIRGLGYNVAYGHSLQAAPAMDFWSGVGEHSRMGQICVTPENGALIRTHAIFFTDLPLVPTQPIDAGITKFCETCGICATVCPVGAIPPKGINRNWESNVTGQSWEDDRENGGTVLMYNIPGYKGWRTDNFKCWNCVSCKGSCPFDTIPDGSFIHSLVKATTSATPLFNGFFSQMERILHYGKQDKDPESWWHEPNAWHVYGTHPNLLKQ